MLNSEAVEQAAQGNRGSLEVFRGRLDGGFSNQILWNTSLPMGWWTSRSLGRCLPPKPMVKRHRRHTEIKEVTRVWISKGSGLDSSFVLGWPTSSFPVSKGSDLPLGVNPEILLLAGLLLGSNSTSNNLIFTQQLGDFMLLCTFGVSTLSSSINAVSVWQLEGGNENVSAPEVGASPGDRSNLAFCERRFTGGTTGCA